jgi:DMSO/TMAO reductase YedYZ molybdopterin-dependent catalytic subunit
LGNVHPTHEHITFHCEAFIMSGDVILLVDGKVERPLQLTFADLDALPEAAQVRDVSRFHPTRQGDGVTLEAILERAGVQRAANYLTLHAGRDDFHVSVPLAPLRDQGILVYRLGRERLAVEHGGPIRFLIRDPAACHTAELDDCANVKYLSRIELTERRGRDTRPASEAAHAALHEAQEQPKHGGTI